MPAAARRHELGPRSAPLVAQGDLMDADATATNSPIAKSNPDPEITQSRSLGRLLGLMTEPLPTRGPSSIRRISNGSGQRSAALRSIPHWNRRVVGPRHFAARHLTPVVRRWSRGCSLSCVWATSVLSSIFECGSFERPVDRCRSDGEQFGRLSRSVFAFSGSSNFSGV